MSDPGTAGDGGSADTSTTTNTLDNDVKTFTQAQIDSIVGRAQSKAAREAQDALLGDLGVDDVSQVKKAIEDAKKAEEARLSNEQRLERKLAEAEAKAQQTASAAAAQLKQARVMLALAGHMDRAAAQRIAPTVQVPDDATDEDLERIVEELREEVPGLFTTQTPNAQPPGTTSQFRRQPPSKTTSQSSAESAAKWAEQWVGDNDSGSGIPLLGH